LLRKRDRKSGRKYSQARRSGIHQDVRDGLATGAARYA
jgi:hypothetical protein